MGWASGSSLAEDLWKLVRPFVPEAERRSLAYQIYDLFCDSDADAWDEDSLLWLDAGLDTGSRGA